MGGPPKAHSLHAASEPWHSFVSRIHDLLPDRLPHTAICILSPRLWQRDFSHHFPTSSLVCPRRLRKKEKNRKKKVLSVISLSSGQWKMKGSPASLLSAGSTVTPLGLDRASLAGSS